MAKNNTVSRIVKNALKPESNKAIKRAKSSIYVEASVWRQFKKLTKHPRGRTSELLEQFMAEYVRLYSEE